MVGETPEQKWLKARVVRCVLDKKRSQLIGGVLGEWLAIFKSAKS
jgi:hypothetical protein